MRFKEIPVEIRVFMSKYFIGGGVVCRPERILLHSIILRRAKNLKANILQIKQHFWRLAFKYLFFVINETVKKLKNYLIFSACDLIIC